MLHPILEDGSSDQFFTARMINTALIGMQHSSDFLTTANSDAHAEATTVTKLGATLGDWRRSTKDLRDR